MPSGAEDLLISHSVHNRGPEAALSICSQLLVPQHLSWPDGGAKPMLQAVEARSTG